MPTGRFTGNDGAASVNGNSYAIKEWSAEETAKTAEGSAAGDIGTHRTFLRTDWKASAKFVCADGDTPTGPFTDLRAGLPVAFAGQVDAGVGVWSATGIITRVGLASPIDDLVTVDVEMESSDGSAQPTFT